MREKELVFVYGTLKFGFSNSGFLLNSQIIGRGETKQNYALYQAELPYLLNDKEHKVKGEVYNVNEETLFYLDMLEGHPYLYTRKKIKILTEKGKTLNCWTYFFNQPKRNHWQLTDGEYKLNNNKYKSLWQ